MNRIQAPVWKTKWVILPEPTMQEKMASNNYNHQGNNNYINYICNNSTSQMSSSQPVSLSDVQLFLNKFYFRLINGEQNSPSQCLPVMNNILSEMRNIVTFINEMEVNVNQNEKDGTLKGTLNASQG